MEEIRSFQFDGSFSLAFLLRETSGDYGNYRIEYEGVWDADTNEELRSEVSSSARGETIKWYYSAANTTKRFLVRYHIEGAVQRYGDAAQFYWKAIEDERALGGALKTLFAVVKGYPALNANEEFLRLHDELTEIEDQIRFARQFYNDIVMRYNTSSEVFPNIIVANLFRFEEAEYFNLDD